LLYASAIGFVVFAILHNVFEALATGMAGAGLLKGLLEGVGVVAFLLALLLCPPGLIVGAAGSIVMFVRDRRRPAKDRGEAA
jgi:hypothetical protein